MTSSNDNKNPCPGAGKCGAQKKEAWLQWLRSNAVDVVVLVSLLLLVSVVVRELLKPRIIIASFDVPKVLEERGYSGAVIAKALHDRVYELSSNVDRERIIPIASREMQAPPVSLGEAKIYIDAIVDYLREQLDGQIGP